MDALAARGDEGRGRLRYAQVRRQTVFDPGISEWGNPAGFKSRQPLTEYIGLGRLTRGSETSQHPKEEKSKEIPKVAASEMG